MASTSSLILIRTKLHRPPVPRDYVARHRLNVEQLTTVPLTLVLAAAGYGKSVLVSGWLDGWDGASAWVSLDGSDNDLRQFLSYVVAAVETAFPSALPETSELLGAPNLPPVSVLAGTLVNELDALVEPLVLVLDDVHRIEAGPVMELIDTFLNHPPREVHLVLVGRQDPFLPIAKLRAQGQVNEIRAEDLRFTPAETKTLLEHALGQDVPAEMAATWSERTEGWVTGIRLASLALAGGDALPSEPFSQRTATRHTMLYLLQEVLARQPPEVRHLLLYSSVPERFCASLCDALHADEECATAGVMDGRAFISWLEEAGLFVIPLDEKQTWYRYHHLFGDLLRGQAERHVGAGEISRVHERASAWFESQGLIDEAIGHAIDAGDADRAGDIVSRNRQLALERDQLVVLDRWLSRLPVNTVESRADLLVASAWVHFLHLAVEEIQPLLERAEVLLTEVPDESLKGEMEYFRGWFACLSADGQASLDHTRNALRLIPASSTMQRSEAELILGMAVQMEEGGEPARRVLEDRLHSSSSTDHMRRSRLLASLVFVSFMEADLARAEKWNRALIRECTEAASSNGLAWGSYFQGLVDLQRLELEDAVCACTRVLGQRFVCDTLRMPLDAGACLVYALQSLGRSDEAEGTVQLLREFAAQGSDPSSHEIVRAIVARVALMQGRWEAAARSLRANPSMPSEVMLWWFEIPSLTHCRVLIAEGSAASLAEAQARFTEYAELNEAQHNTCQLIPILALQAVAHAKQGEATQAREVLDRALGLAEPGGFIFPFLEPGAPMADLLRESLDSSRYRDFVKQILTAFYEGGKGLRPGEPMSAGAPSTPGTDLLTPRQLEVLELLGQGLYQKEIAAKLFVSPETVKTHLAMIYRKLGVSNRRHAVDEARARNLIARL
jgi:LuxR family maltose regulon positive regulatory protein